MIKPSKYNNGFTLIEFMVAITVGLILLAGLSYVFLGMKKSNTAQTGLTEIQENGRFVMYFMGNDIQNAGWADVDTFGYGVFTTPYINFDSGLTADGTNDQITIRYANDEDCIGTSSGSDGIAENTYYVDGNGQLLCSGSGASGGQPLISGVESLQLLYGVDTDGDFTPNRFESASTIDSTEREQISAVKIVLLLASDSDVHKSNTSQTFTFNGATLTFNDKKVRKIFSTTVIIPNKPIFAG